MTERATGTYRGSLPDAVRFSERKYREEVGEKAYRTAPFGVVRYEAGVEKGLGSRTYSRLLPERDRYPFLMVSDEARSNPPDVGSVEYNV